LNDTQLGVNILKVTSINVIAPLCWTRWIIASLTPDCCCLTQKERMKIKFKGFLQLRNLPVLRIYWHEARTELWVQTTECFFVLSSLQGQRQTVIRELKGTAVVHHDTFIPLTQQVSVSISFLTSFYHFFISL
jgi:hypothetical protein